MIKCKICDGATTNYRTERVLLANGDWTNLFADREIGPGVNSLKILAYGDGVAEYRPHFCPECGRRVNYDI